MDSVAGPSRPTPLPYDDPYADWPNSGQEAAEAVADHDPKIELDDRGMDKSQSRDRPMRGRGRGRGERRVGRNGRDNERRGRGRGQRNGWQGGQRRDNCGLSDSRGTSDKSLRSLSPTSLAIARATGQQSSSFAGGHPVNDPYDPQFLSVQHQDWQQSGYGSGPTNYPPAAQNFQYQPYVQPHINPRFASQFGLDMSMLQPQIAQRYQYGGGNWDSAWPQNAGHASTDTQQPEGRLSSDTVHPSFSNYDQTRL